ncbi:Uncharacterised protein [Candidatus Tiddalikarchaeum anstoanum]|nr:Uncharacterised protein [Candidatus Tiddalikarchaeum anstoanum]
MTENSKKQQKNVQETPEDKFVKELKDVFKEDLLSVCNVEFTVEEEDKKQEAGKELTIPKTEQETIAIVNDLVNEKIIDLIKNYKGKKARILPLSGLWQSCYDRKYELLQAIVTSKVLFDKGLVRGLAAAEKLKMMTLDKLKRYIVTLILVGSVSRGTMTETSDVDLAFVIDDTDVKQMSRQEVLARLRSMILGEAAKTGFEFNIQVYLLTDFWQSLRDTQPVIFSMVRDGVPLFDQGMFTPWRILLKTGRMQPSPEAVSQFYRTGRLLLQDVNNSIKEIVIERVFLSMFNPAQAAAMMIGIPPTDAINTPRQFRQHFVEKEKLVEPKYADYLDEILKIRKDVEHGKKAEVTAKELLAQMEHAEDFINRIEKLFEEIRSKQIHTTIDDIEKECTDAIIKALSAIGVKATKDNVTELMREKLLNSGIITGSDFRFYTKEINELRTDYKKDMLTLEESHRAEKRAKEFINTLENLSQTLSLKNTEKAKIHIKYAGNRNGEVWVLGEELFIIKDLKPAEKEVIKASLKSDGGIEKTQISNMKELTDARTKFANKTVSSSLKSETFNSINKIFGGEVEFVFA